MGGGDENVIESQLHDQVDEVHPGKGDLEDAHRPDGVKKDLEGAEEGLAENRVQDDGFEGCWQIGVKAVHAERLVVGQVVWLYSRIMLAICSCQASSIFLWPYPE